MPNGGFGWPHNDCDNTYHNITPPIIDGVRQAYKVEQNAGYLGVMLNSGNYDLTNQYNNGNARFGAFIAYQMWNLSRDSGDSVYYDFTESNFFAELEAGSYGEDDIDTQGWITAVETNRTGAWINLRPWEFSSLVVVAQRHCRNTQASQFETALLRGLGTLDNTESDNVYSDLSGLADYLVSQQNSDGSFYWHSNLTMPDDGDKDTQTTSYAILALIKAQETLPGSDYIAAIDLGKAYIMSMQTTDGGFASYPGDTTHNTEVEGEALTAIGTIGVYDRIYKSGMECYVN